MGAAVAICLSARSWEFGQFAESGTVLAATTYSLETVEPPDTEYVLALVPKKRGSGCLGVRDVPGYPIPKRHKILNLRPRKVKSEAQRPRDRLE